MAATQEIGLPPNVPPRPPTCTASMSSARPVTPAIGMPPPIDLPHTHEVGLDAVVLDAGRRAGAAHAGLHLVVDVEDAVLLAEGLERLREALGAAGRKPPSPCTGS